MARPNVAERNDYIRGSFTAGGITHDVYRGGNRGPVVLLLHEMPSLSWRTIRLANRIRDRGNRVVMPILIGGIRDEPAGRLGKAVATVAAGAEFVVYLGGVCVSWQIVAILAGRAR